jgi:hypothetical protein
LDRGSNHVERLEIKISSKDFRVREGDEVNLKKLSLKNGETQLRKPASVTYGPFSGMPKRKLENGERRLAPQSHQSRAESPEFARQRLGRASLTRGNVGSSRTAGKRIGETALAGWARRIRTYKCRFQNWPLSVAPNFPFISEHLAIRDFSRLSYQRVTCTPVQSILQSDLFNWRGAN